MTKMTYKVTQQYARDEENPCAEFFEFNDANFFIERKILSDSEKHITIIYRLFDDQKLIKEFNIEKINCSIRIAQYATGNTDLPYSIGHFKVSKEHSANNALAAFAVLNDAELFVEDKLTHSHGATHYIFDTAFDNTVLITQMDQHIKKQFLEEKNNQGKGQSTSFRPKPLHTAPRPPGTPPSLINDDNEDENNK